MSNEQGELIALRWKLGQVQDSLDKFYERNDGSADQKVFEAAMWTLGRITGTLSVPDEEVPGRIARDREEAE